MKENNEFSVEITQQMLDAYPIKEYKEMEVPVRSGRAKVYLYYPNKANYDYPAVFYLHGGGFVKGHHIRDNYFCQKICHETGALVIDIDYLTAPEHPFPYALNESYDVVKYFMFHREQYGFDSDRTAIIGNSAGGNLAAGIIRLTIENSEPYVISKLVLDWSPLDLFTPHREKAKVWDEQAEKTAQRGAYYNECYVKGHDLKNPLVSPYYTEEYI